MKGRCRALGIRAPSVLEREEFSSGGGGTDGKNGTTRVESKKGSTTKRGLPRKQR